MVKLRWLAHWQAYAVWINGTLHGLVRLKSWALPFSESECQVEFE